VARRRLQELGLSPEEVVGTGEGGRITLRDVERALHEREQRWSRSEREAGEATSSPGQSGHDEEAVERPSAMRRTIAVRMMESLRNSAQFTLHTEVDAGELVGLRQ